ncbi:hypothetical protein I4U23_020275 [Adineta vaga]|nr:hypothetical protein I4U23_020275 [Adineta vaga]
MTAFHVQDQPYLTKDRVNDLTWSDLIVCSLCNGILWSPIGCQTCDSPYCTACVDDYHKKQNDSSRCPKDTCPTYIQRPCPPANLLVLRALKITCRYNANGCTETLVYDDLEKHEKLCGYRLITCSGCDEKIVKNEFLVHEATCSLVILTCQECNSLFQRQHENKHTEIKCLRVQLNQIRDDMKEKEQKDSDKMAALESQVHDLNDIIKQLSI